MAAAVPALDDGEERAMEAPFATENRSPEVRTKLASPKARKRHAATTGGLLHRRGRSEAYQEDIRLLPAKTKDRDVEVASTFFTTEDELVARTETVVCACFYKHHR